LLKSGWLRSFVSTEMRILQRIFSNCNLKSFWFFNKINYLSQEQHQAAR